MRTRSHAIGVGLVALGALCFIVNAGVSRVALRAGVSPLLLTTVRVSFTFLALLAVAAAFGRPALRRPQGRLFGLVLVHGAIGVAALQWTYFVAIDRLPVGMALLLEYQAPIIVAVWARLVQGETVRARIWVGLALAVAGLAAATEVWSGARFSSVGIAGGLGAAVCFSAYFLIGEAGVGSMEPLRVLLWSFGVAAVVMNVVAPLTGLDGALLGEHVSMLGALDALSAPVWGLLLWNVLLGTLTPFALTLYALSMVRATTVTMVAMLEPIGVAALGWAWFGERLGVIAVCGCVAVVAGILVAQSARIPRLDVEPPTIT